MASSKVIEVTKDNFESEVLQSDKPVLLDFSATWCGPCKMLAPIIENVASKHDGVKVAKLDIDQVPDVANKYRVQSVPTVLVFKGGKEVARQVGLVPEAKLVDLFRSHL
ncbi:MAG TPA: thioredoxin [Polyangiaceae bacterium]|nr:thioredoxin [Polyangiaceae bacterium]